MTARRAAAAVTIDVADNGCGVSAPMLDRLFEPFATSKGRGLGLGLVVARALVRRARGDLDLVATGPDGTVFRCTLPGVPAPARD